MYACELNVGASDLDGNVDANAQNINDGMSSLGDLLPLGGAHKPVDGFSMQMPTKQWSMTESWWEI